MSNELLAAIAEPYNKIKKILNEHLIEDTREEVLGSTLAPLLRSGSGKTLAALCLLGDVLRLVTDACFIDGHLSSSEEKMFRPLIKETSRLFAKYRPEYAAFANEPSIEPSVFLKFYASDSLPLGYAAKSTAWAGLAVCANLSRNFESPDAIEEYEKMALAATASITALGRNKQQAEEHLGRLRDLIRSAPRDDENNKDADDSDYERLSNLGNDPDTWADLSEEDLKQLVIMKCIEYGVSHDGSLIRSLFRLYKVAMDRLDTPERMRLLLGLTEMIEEQKGQGYMGLMMFLTADDDYGIVSTAAMNLAVLFPLQDGNVLTGPSFVVNQLLLQDQYPMQQGAALGGILLLGDRRLLPLLCDAWSKVSEAAQMELTKSRSGFVTECVVEFWLRCLESGCCEAVFGSAVAAIAKMPASSQVPFVSDVQRVFPVYEDSENPMQSIRQTSFGDYLEKIRPRLEALEEAESEPKVIPKIFEFWDRPNR